MYRIWFESTYLPGPPGPERLRRRGTREWRHALTGTFIVLARRQPAQPLVDSSINEPRYLSGLPRDCDYRVIEPSECIVYCTIKPIDAGARAASANSSIRGAGTDNHEKGHRNPIIPGFNPDPTVAFKDGRYYLATSTFEYFPGVPIYTSVDLVDWTLIGHALNRRSQLDMRTVECSGGIYAPSLRYNERRKRRYMTTSLVLKRSKMAPHDMTPNPTGFYVWSDDITDETKWSDPIYYDLFFDDDGGKAWLSWATGIPDYVAPKGCYNLAVWTVEIDLETGDSVGE
ncbi:hypothetical protein EHS25_008955 [Saitozyma podzolica]|uniref:Beta-xylosidase C-terminal Concanavalin A-like domain-containing protein n=1 Tax=Saitozyma podzolica TaxID=1890683 RepID=A0A427YKI6_9TREE|nr:hypothetical protein EHS25_008955 [Saitozyma podzolica]